MTSLLLILYILLGLGFAFLFYVVKLHRKAYAAFQSIPRRFHGMKRSIKQDRIIGTRARDPAKKLAMMQELVQHLMSGTPAGVVEWRDQRVTSAVCRIPLGRGAVDFQLDCQYDIYATDADVQTDRVIQHFGAPMLQMLQDWAHEYELNAMQNWLFGVHPKAWHEACDLDAREHADFLRDCIALVMA